MKKCIILIFYFTFYLPANATIKRTEDNAYTSKIHRGTLALYFNLVPVTPHNYSFWKTYAEHTQKMSAYFYRLYTDVMHNPRLIHMYKHSFDISKHEQNLFTKQLEAYLKKYPPEEESPSLTDQERKLRAEKRGWEIYRTGLIDGAAGMRNVLTLSETDKNVFIAFVSRKPFSLLKLTLDEDEPLFDVRTYQALYHNIIISMAVIHAPSTPLTTHYGIFRNPLSFHAHFMGLEEANKGLSLPLHGFAAQIERAFFEGHKKFIISWPTHSMTAIFMQKLAPKYIYVGTNLSYLSPKEDPDTLYLPRIIEKDFSKTGLIAIAKKNIDIRRKKDFTVDSIEYESEEVSDFSDVTPSANRVLIELEGLIPFFEALQEKQHLN